MHVFPAYREEHLLKMPFYSVIDLYNRALEIETCDVIEESASTNNKKIDLSDDLCYNIHTGQYE